MRKKHSYPDYMKKWRAENRERIAAYNRTYNSENHVERARVCRAWQRAHPDEWSLHQKVKAANEHYPGHLTVNDLRSVIDRCGKECHWCGKKDLVGPDFTLEHLQPFNDPEFLVIACRSCNCRRMHIPPKSLEERRRRVAELARIRRAKWAKYASQEEIDKERQKNRLRHRQWFLNLTPEKKRAYYDRMQKWQRENRNKRKDKNAERAAQIAK